MKNFGLKTNKLHRIIAATICVVMLLGLVFQVTLFSAPEGEEPKPEQAVTRVADASTINSWKEYFGDDTSSAGKIWTDKSVMTTTPDLAEGGDTTALTPQENNFMVGLSALSSNKTVIGESALPIDTVFVVDISSSMYRDIILDDNNEKSKMESTVAALNEAIQAILDMNEENRVGVVLYSGALKNEDDSAENTAVCPMPLGRYENTVDKGTYFSIGEDGAKIKLEGNVESEDVQFEKNWMHDVSGFTYIQNGLMAALEVFEGAKTEQDEKRVPVITLLSDGAPTAVRENYAERGSSTIGKGEETDFRRTFLTQLTAAWVKSSLENVYLTKKPLFYSIGLLTETYSDDNEYARTVLNPKVLADDEETVIDKELNQWWNQFLQADKETLETYITQYQEIGEEVQIEKVDDLIAEKDQYYVDEYFEVDNGEGLKQAFKDIVEKIRLQSESYPTDVEEGDSNYSGYLVFQDEIGEYMHIEDVKGVMYEEKLYNGKDFAEKMSKENLDNLSEEGIEFLDSLMVRLGIPNLDDAKVLFENAKQTGQISSNELGYSNYIGWYADESGKYMAPYVEGKEAPLGAGAINKSYFYYGVPEETLEKTNLMYLGVRITEQIGISGQTVRFSIPASLIPMVKYNITKKEQDNQKQEIEVKPDKTTPVHLFYEVGIDEGIDEYDWSEVDDEYPFKSQYESLRECKFYTNVWNKDSAEAGTSMMFEPSTKNEFYYYTENASIYVESNGQYVPYVSDEKPSGASYYYESVAYSESGQILKNYILIDENALKQAKKDENNWFIPKGVFKYNPKSEKEYILKKNAVNDVIYTNKPSVLRKTTMYEDSEIMVSVALGNNGEMGFRQGKLLVKKQVKDNAYAENHDEETLFEFEMTLDPLKGKNSVERITEEKEDELVVCSLQEEINRFSLKNQEYKTYWLPLGQKVSIKETGEAAKEYKTSVTVTQEKQTNQSKEKGTIGRATISDSTTKVLFVNDLTGMTTILLLDKTGEGGEKLQGAEFYLYQCQIAEPISPDKPYPPNDKNDPNYEEELEEYNKELAEYELKYEEYLVEYQNYTNHLETEHNEIIEENSEQTCWKKIGKGTSNTSGQVMFYDLENTENSKSRLLLKKGVYRLVETKAPKGYMKPVGQWNIKIVPAGSVEFEFFQVIGNNGEKPPAISKVTENGYEVPNYKPLNPPITGGRGIDRFLILGATVAISGLMITVHLVLQRKRGKL